MWRWLAWAARIAATALLLSFLSIWTTGYIVNSYMETLLKQLNLPLQTQPFALSGVWGKLWGASPVTGEKERAGESRDDIASSNSPSRNGQPDRSSVNESSVDRSGQGNAEFPVDGQSAPESGESPSDKGDGASGAYPDGAGGRMGEPENTQPPAEGDAKGSAAGDVDGAVPVFGAEDRASALSDEQRQALNAIMSKLNGEQLGALSGYLEDGLTPEELTAVQDLIKPSLTDSEYAQIMDALAPGRANADESTGTSPDRE